MKKVFFIVCCVALALNASAAAWYVSKDGLDGNDGRSWETAQSTIGLGIDNCKPGDTLLVEAGVYYESIELKEGIAIIGVNGQAVLDGKSDKSSRKSKKRGDDTSVDTSEDTSEDTSVPQTATSSDFKRGSVILFQDDFKGETVGEFPSKWDLLDGSAEVKTLGGVKAVEVTNNGVITPLIKEPGAYLPEEFTIEYEFYYWTGGKNDIGLNDLKLCLGCDTNRSEWQSSSSRR